MFRSFYLRFVAAMVLVLTFSACTTAPVIRDDLQADFARSGRFAVSVVDNATAKQNAVQGGYLWVEGSGRLVLDLSNPMGSTLARVQVADNGAVLQRSDGSVEYAETPEALVLQVLGSPIPVSMLRYWLQGQVAGDAIIEKQEANHVLEFSQHGWQVRLSRYDDIGPRLLVMNRRDGQTQISVRLVVDNS